MANVVAVFRVDSKREKLRREISWDLQIAGGAWTALLSTVVQTSCTCEGAPGWADKGQKLLWASKCRFHSIWHSYGSLIWSFWNSVEIVEVWIVVLWFSKRINELSELGADTHGWPAVIVNLTGHRILPNIHLVMDLGTPSKGANMRNSLTALECIGYFMRSGMVLEKWLAKRMHEQFLNCTCFMMFLHFHSWR